MDTKISKDATIGEKYGPVLTITTQEDADAYYAACVRHMMDCGGYTKPAAEKIEKLNIKSFAAHQEDPDVVARINRLFGVDAKPRQPVKGRFPAGKQQPIKGALKRAAEIVKPAKTKGAK